MYRVLFAIVLALVMWVPTVGWAAAVGTVTQSVVDVPGTFVVSPMKVLTFTCIGSVDDGSIPDTAISAANLALLKGYYLYTVTADPGGTPPDVADVFLLDAASEDLLGSIDGGTTANKGLSLIHATLTKTTMPFTHYLGQHYFPAVTGTITLRVTNQATVSATYTITLIFAR